jgi:aspartate aminotransferase/aminotransferase
MEPAKTHDDSKTTPASGPPSAPACLPGVVDIDRVGSRELEDKIRRAVRQGVDVLSLEGSPRLPLCSDVRAAAVAALADPWPQPSHGAPELVSAIAAAWQREHGTGIEERNVLVSNGATQGLNVLFRALLAPGDNVVVPAPNFFFSGAVALARGEIRHVPFGVERDWTWDPGALERAIDSRTRAIVFSNPVNPTGYLPSRDVLAALLEIAERRGIFVVSDESFDRFVYGDGFTAAGRLAGPEGRLIVVRSFSKSFGLAPLRIGYVVAPERVVRSLTTVLEWECLYVADGGQRVAAAVLVSGAPSVDGILDRYRRHRDRVWRAVNENPCLSCALPAATPFVFVDVTALTALGQDPVDVLLAVGIPTVAGRYFGAPGYVRLAIGGSADVLDALVKRARVVGTA